MDKYEYIIELGKNVPKINEDDKVDENIIKVEVKFGSMPKSNGRQFMLTVMH